MRNFLKKTKTAARVHLILAAVWLTMILPTLIWWKESVLWIGLMSCYALFAAHVASYQAADSAGVDDATHKKLNALADSLADFLEHSGYPGHANELRYTVGLEKDE